MWAMLTPSPSELPPMGVVRSFMVPGTMEPLYCWRVGSFKGSEEIWPSMCVPQSYIRMCVETAQSFQCPAVQIRGNELDSGMGDES